MKHIIRHSPPGRMDMLAKEAYQKKVETELSKLATQVEMWQVKANLASAEHKRECMQQLRALRIIHRIAQARLEELKVAGGESWEDSRARTDGVLSELRNAMLNASLRFQ
jgi:hypothetical protein